MKHPSSPIDIELTGDVVKAVMTSRSPKVQSSRCSCLRVEAERSTATIQKIITEILGDKSGLSFAKDARDLLIDCSVEFVSLISSEANEIAEREAKKTIATEHIDKALRELGFPEYVQEVLASAGEHKEQLKVLVLDYHIEEPS